jgi:hypothetical protein
MTGYFSQSGGWKLKINVKAHLVLGEGCFLSFHCVITWLKEQRYLL